MDQKTITTEYARELLGEIEDKMTDKEIENLLNMLRFLCSKTISSVIYKNEDR